MATSTRALTAAAVSRTLAAAGFDRTTSHTSRVKGWRTSTAGFTVENEVDFASERRLAGYTDGEPYYLPRSVSVPTGVVSLGWVVPRWSDDDATERIESMSKVLEERGIHVEQPDPGEGAVLLSRRDENGEIVRPDRYLNLIARRTP